MRVLIIGGTGTISEGITRFLLKKGFDVTLFNRAQTEADIPYDYKLIKGDRKEYDKFENQMREAGPFDCVIDMVCYTPEDARSAVRAFKDNTDQFIFCSTVDVYTKPAKSYPITEDAEKNPSKSFEYAYKKAKCEDIFSKADEKGYFSVTTIRPAYTYRGGLTHSFGWGSYYIDRILKGKPIIVHGDGSSFWVACHADDVAKAFVEAVGNEKCFGKDYHVTGEEWMTWNQYHKKVAKALNAPSPELVHIPTDLLVEVLPQKAEWCAKNFRYNNIFDNSAAKQDLNFQYIISWEKGVQKAVKYLKNKRGGIEDSENYPFYDEVVRAWKQLGDNMADALSDLTN